MQQQARATNHFSDALCEVLSLAAQSLHGVGITRHVCADVLRDVMVIQQLKHTDALTPVIAGRHEHRAVQGVSIVGAHPRVSTDCGQRFTFEACCTVSIHSPHTEREGTFVGSPTPTTCEARSNAKSTHQHSLLMAHVRFFRRPWILSSPAAWTSPASRRIANGMKTSGDTTMCLNGIKPQHLTASGLRPATCSVAFHFAHHVLRDFLALHPHTSTCTFPHPHLCTSLHRDLHSNINRSRWHPGEQALFRPNSRFSTGNLFPKNFRSSRIQPWMSLRALKWLRRFQSSEKW